MKPCRFRLTSAVHSQYDEGGQRIKKLYHYFSRYFDEDCDCPTVQDSTMEGSVFGGGGMQMMGWPGDPPEPEPCMGEYCPYAGHSEKLYLYDGGVLLATFNGYDQVIDVHVNGPTGRLATYYHNNDFELFFIVNDHLGKERDNHAGFEFDYFGARYYDPRIGSFTTIDKASQFASGYVYGANNPLIGTDPDGNLFGIDDLIAGVVGFTVGYIQHGIQTGNWGNDALKAGAISAGSAWVALNTGGAAGGLIAKEGSATYAIASSTIGGAVGSTSGQLMSGRSFNDHGFLRGVAGGAAGGAAGALTGQYVARDPFLPGFVGGGVSGAISNPQDPLMGFAEGGLWGVGSAALTDQAYKAYGSIKSRAAFPDGVPNGKFCHEFRSQLLDKGEHYMEWNRLEPSGLEESIYDVDGGLVIDANQPIEHMVHSGVSLGRTQYGQHMILSKLGPQLPVTVQTGVSLNYYFRYVINAPGPTYGQTFSNAYYRVQQEY